MRILYIDIDSLRADHLGCYGYKRNTSPNIDKIAAEGIRFSNCFASDTPCLPSRSAMFTGRFGIHTGVVTHGGTHADPFIQGPTRNFSANEELFHWPKVLNDVVNLKTVSVSSFANRHAAWWYYQGFSEMHDTGKAGGEIADDVLPIVEKWLGENGQSDNWFLHAHFWDPHTPYRTPKEYGNPFEDVPLSEEWLTGERIERQKDGTHHNPDTMSRYCGKKGEDIGLDDYKKWIDGYDTAIRYTDDAVGRICEILEEKGVLDETIIIVTTDHGEQQGELNIYGDHTSASYSTSRIPFILRWPGLETKKEFASLYYQCDLAATLLELAGAKVPDQWDGLSFAGELKEAKEGGRDYLVSSHCAWSCQRSVIFDDHIMTKTYDAGRKNYPEYLLFNTKKDPRSLYNLAETEPELLDKGKALLETWHAEMMQTSQNPDPLQGTLDEGGPWHTRRMEPQQSQE